MRLRLHSLSLWSLMALLALVSGMGLRAAGHGFAASAGGAKGEVHHWGTCCATIHQATDTRAARPLFLAELCEEEVEDRERHLQELPVLLAGQGSEHALRLLQHTTPPAPSLGAEHAGLPARHLRLRVMRI